MSDVFDKWKTSIADFIIVPAPKNARGKLGKWTAKIHQNFTYFFDARRFEKQVELFSKRTCMYKIAQLSSVHISENIQKANEKHYFLLTLYGMSLMDVFPKLPKGKKFDYQFRRYRKRSPSAAAVLS